MPVRPRLRSVVVAVVGAAMLATTAPATAAAPVPSDASGLSAAAVAPRTGAVESSLRTAAARAPRLTVVPGNKQLTASWTKVAGAKKYVVEYATNKKFKKAKRVVTRSTTARVTKVKLRTTYYVRVKAVKAGKDPRSKTVRTRPISSSTGRPVVTVKAVGTNKVRVSWKRLPRGTSITIVGSYDDKALGRKSSRFSVSKIAATETSRTITVPASFRKYVGAGTGNAVYVQVWSYNGKRKSTSRAVHTRVNAVPVTASAKDNLTFASYNVGSIVSTAKKPAFVWAKRRGPVKNAINRSGAAVVAVQEATTAKHTNGVRHYQDLDALLANHKLAYSEQVVGTAGTIDGAKRTKGDHIFYDPRKVVSLGGGIQSTSGLLAAGDRLPKDRYFAWAKLRNKANGAEFYVASVHLQTGSTTQIQRHRIAATRAITRYLNAKPGAATLPVILMGDLNSDVGRYPHGATTVLNQAGYQDAASAPVTSGLQWATANTQRHTSDGGYPVKPFRYAYSATRIDYIMVKNGNGVARYANQVLLDSAGRFLTSYRGSDHNLQVAVIPIAR